MGSGSDGQQPRQIGNYTFLENLGGGALAHVYLAMDNQNDADNGKVIDINRGIRKNLDPAEILLHLELPENIFKDFFSLLKRENYSYSTEETWSDALETRTYTHVNDKRS